MFLTFPEFLTLKKKGISLKRKNMREKSKKEDGEKHCENHFLPKSL